MTDAFVGTDVIIRLLTGDDPIKQASAVALFQRVEAGELTLSAPDTVIADAVFVLSSPRLFNLARRDIRELLLALLRLPDFRVDSKRVVMSAVDIWAENRFDFGDAMMAASLYDRGAEIVYSYDRDFDRMAGVVRVEP